MRLNDQEAGVHINNITLRILKQEYLSKYCNCGNCPPPIDRGLVRPVEPGTLSSFLFRADRFQGPDLGIGLASRETQGMTRPQFARYSLMRLGIGGKLRCVALKPELPYKLAPVEEVLALHSELRSPG
jgi:hypothetical protein